MKRKVCETLVIGLLSIACVTGLQISFLLAQAGGAFGELKNELQFTVREIRNNQNVIAQNFSIFFNDAKGSYAAQKKFYEESAKKNAEDFQRLTATMADNSERLGRLIDGLDERTERITVSAESLLANGGNVTAMLSRDATVLSDQANAALLEATLLFGQMRETAASQAIEQSLTNLSAATRKLDSTMGHLDGTARNAEEASGYVRDMLSPTKKSFWRRVLELLIPRPAISVK